MGRQLVQRPGRCECRKDEAVQRRVNIRRHRLLDDFDAAASVVRQMFGDKRLAKRLDSRFLDNSLSGISLEAFDSAQFRSRTSFAQSRPLRENLRRRVLLGAAGLQGGSEELSDRPPVTRPATRPRLPAAEHDHRAPPAARRCHGNRCMTRRTGQRRTSPSCSCRRRGGGRPSQR